MDANFSTLFSDIKKDLTAYITLKLEILKLDIYEKSSIFSSVLLYGVVLFLIAFFAVLFLFLALGLYIGTLLNSFAIGMALIAVLCAVVLCILLWQKKRIHHWLVNMFVEQIALNNEDEDENEDK